jgi:histidine triad (HIT) family protein
MSSLFTKIIAREIPASIIYEDENHLAFLDINPMEKWHTLVIPKKEYETIMNMPEWEYLELQRVIFLIAKHYEVTLWCGINIIQNNKTIAGQDVMHVHFHVIPRSVKKDFLNFSVWDNYREWEMQEYKNKLTFDS